MRRVAVFASRSEIDTPDAFSAAYQVGRLLGENGLTMLYDGRPVGPIGTIARAVSDAGGLVVTLDQEFPARIGSEADAYLGLPGGFPSLEEAFAAWGWSSGDSRERPLGLLDLDDYYSSLLRDASDETVDRFVRESQRGLLIVSKEPIDLLRRLVDYRPPETRRVDDWDDE